MEEVTVLVFLVCESCSVSGSDRTLESCSSSVFEPDEEGKQRALVGPGHVQLLGLDPLLLLASSHTSMTTVSFRCLGSLAR